MATSSSLKFLNRSLKAKPVSESKKRLKLKGIFDKYDIDKDGKIDLQELKQLLEEGKNNNEFSENEAIRILQKADIDSDGILSFNEFVEIADQEPSLYATAFTRYALILVPPRYRDEPETNIEIADVPSELDVIGIMPNKLPGFYERAMTACPPPITMILFSLIDVAFFLYDWYTQGKITTNGFFADMFAFVPDKIREKEYWRFISYMFIHGSIDHIVSNVIVQIALGVPLELVHNWWRVIIVYFAGVLAGSLGTSVISPRTVLVGASGGVYALITAHIANVIMNKTEMYHPCWQLWTFVLFFTFDISKGIYSKLTNPEDNVGVWAHLFGGLAGLLVGIGIFRNLVKKRHEKIIWWISVTIYLLLMTGAIMKLFYPEHVETIILRLETVTNTTFT